MSGTSLDGIDAVLLRVEGNGARTRFHLLSHSARKYPQALAKHILRNSNPDTASLDDLTRLNVLLAHHYADAVRVVVRKAGKKLRAIDLIGCHGQTIRHLPVREKLFGKRVAATLQLGDPSVLATLTGIPTVGNFRPADMAVGGQGAPLVPYFDWLAFRSPSRNRLLLNIGGIANLTALPAGCTVKEVRAFDTGPGNMVVDALMKRFLGKAFDKNGAVAGSGEVVEQLLIWMMGHPFLQKHPPKSTGREDFGDAFLREVSRRARRRPPEDIITTSSLFTCLAILSSYERSIRKGMNADELIVSGGGARNQWFMSTLRQLFHPINVLRSDDLGVPSQAKEAICFAILANETVSGNPANIPAVTGARQSVVLGSVSRPAGSI